MKRPMTKERDITPWGAAQGIYPHGAIKAFDGQADCTGEIEFVTTAGHGGYRLSEDRQKALIRRLNLPEPSQPGDPLTERILSCWYEEDCEWCWVAIAFPEDFDDVSIHHAVETARMTFRWCVEGAEKERANGANGYWTCRLAVIRRLIEWLDSPGHQQDAILRAVAKVTKETADLFRRGGLSSPPKGSPPKSWTVHLSCGDDRRTYLFKEYPVKEYYSEAELEALTYARVLSLGQITACDPR